MFNSLRSHLTKRLAPFAAARIMNSRICNVSTNTNKPKKDGENIFYQARIDFLKESVQEHQKMINEHEKEIKDLRIRIDALKLESMGNQMRSYLIKRIFPYRLEVPFKNLKEVEDCAAGFTDFKMTKEELSNWEELVSKLSQDGMSIEQVESAIEYVTDRTNTIPGMKNEPKDVSTSEEAVPKD